MKYDSEKVRNKLQEKLNRLPTESEVLNAQNDPLVICELLVENYKNLETRIGTIEAKLPK